MGFPVDPEVAQAVQRTAAVLADLGHHVVEESPEFDGLQAMRQMTDVWFFGFDLRLEGYAARSGHAIGPDTLEPVTCEDLSTRQNDDATRRSCRRSPA